MNNKQDNIPRNKEETLSDKQINIEDPILAATDEILSALAEGIDANKPKEIQIPSTSTLDPNNTPASSNSQQRTHKR